MKIGVCVKEVPDTATKIELSADAQGIKKDSVKYVVNPYDEFAVEEALKLKEQGVATEVVLLSIGPDRSKETIRKALAMGADRAVHLVNEELPFAEGFAIASMLKAMVKQEQIEGLLLGKQAVDDDGYQVGPMLAGLLGWTQAMNVIEVKIEGGSATCVREVEGGSREILQINKPFVIGVTKGINEPRYATLKGIMAAKKKELKQISLSDVNVDLNALKTLTIDQFSLPAERGAVKMIEGDVSAQAAELVRALREEAKVI